MIIFHFYLIYFGVFGVFVYMMITGLVTFEKLLIVWIPVMAVSKIVLLFKVFRRRSIIMKSLAERLRGQYKFRSKSEPGQLPPLISFGLYASYWYRVNFIEFMLNGKSAVMYDKTWNAADYYKNKQFFALKFRTIVEVGGKQILNIGRLSWEYDNSEKLYNAILEIK